MGVLGVKSSRSEKQKEGINYGNDSTLGFIESRTN